MNVILQNWHRIRDVILSLTLLVYSAGSVYYALRDDPNSHGDWLVHYGDGFTRRGLIGEIALTIQENIGLDPRAVIVTIQISVFTLFIAVARKYFLEKLDRFSLFILFIPGGLLYMFAEPSVVGRKEYLFFLGVALWFAWVQLGSRSTWRWIALTSLWAIVFLSHESAILFFPGVWLAVWFIARRGMQPLRNQAGMLAGPLVAWVVTTPVLLFSSNRDQEVLLCDRVMAAGYTERICDGALGYMDQSVTDLGSMVTSALTRTDSAIYGFSLLLALALFAATLGAKEASASHIAAPLGVLLIGLILLGLVASDWGRWLHMFIVCLGLYGSIVSGSVGNRRKVSRVSLAFYPVLFLLAGFAFNGGEWRSPALNLVNITYFLEGGMYSGD